MDWDGWVKGVCLFSAFSPPPPVVLLSFYTYTMPPPCLSLHLVPLPAYFTFHPSLSIGGGALPFSSFSSLPSFFPIPIPLSVLPPVSPRSVFSPPQFFLSLTTLLPFPCLPHPAPL